MLDDPQRQRLRDHPMHLLRGLRYHVDHRQPPCRQMADDPQCSEHEVNSDEDAKVSSGRSLGLFRPNDDPNRCDS